MPIPLRIDFDAAASSGIARKSKDGPDRRGHAADRAGLGGEVQRPWARGSDRPQAARPALEAHRRASGGPAGAHR